VIKPKNLLAEDALVSNQPLNYTLKAETSLIVWFIPTKQASSLLPSDLKEQMREQSATKYRFLNERMGRIET
jgi:CRP-like cAMP-binding protein